MNNNKNLLCLTLGEVKSCVKKGKGIQDLMDKYGCDEDTLLERINKIAATPKEASDAIRDLRQKDKRKKKKSQSRYDGTSEQAKYKSAATDEMKTPIPYNNVNVPELLQKAETSIQSFEYAENGKNAQPTISDNILKDVKVKPIDFTKIPVNAETESNNTNNAIEDTEKAEEETISSDTYESTIVEAVVEPDNGNELEGLNKKLNDINTQINECKLSINDLKSDKRKNFKELDEICAAIQRIENSLRLQKQKFEKIYADNKQIEERHNCEEDKLKQLQQDKEKIELRIRELMSITLYCEEADNKSFDYTVGQFDFTVAMVTEKFTSFFKSDFDTLLDEFPVHDLKRVARIILATEEIEQENKSCKVELCFNKKSNLTDLLELMGKTVKIIKDN